MFTARYDLGLYIKQNIFRSLRVKITWFGLIKGNVELRREFHGFLSIFRLKSSYYAERGNKIKGYKKKSFLQLTIQKASHFILHFFFK